MKSESLKQHILNLWGKLFPIVDVTYASEHYSVVMRCNRIFCSDDEIMAFDRMNEKAVTLMMTDLFREYDSEITWSLSALYEKPRVAVRIALKGAGQFRASCDQ